MSGLYSGSFLDIFQWKQISLLSSKLKLSHPESVGNKERQLYLHTCALHHITNRHPLSQFSTMYIHVGTTDFQRALSGNVLISQHFLRLRWAAGFQWALSHTAQRTPTRPHSYRKHNDTMKSERGLRGTRSAGQPFAGWGLGSSSSGGGASSPVAAWPSSCVERLTEKRFQYREGGGGGRCCPREDSTIRVRWSSDQTDVNLAGASPSSRSCGLVRGWGGGWEGPLAATPPCLPAPHRSRSPGRGSEDPAEQRWLWNKFKEMTHSLWMRESGLRYVRQARADSSSIILFM